MIPENTVQAAKARKQFNSPVQLWQRAAQKGAVSSGYMSVATNCCPSALLVHSTGGKWCVLLESSPASQQEWGVRSLYQTFRVPYYILNLIFIPQKSVATSLYQRHSCFFKPISDQLLGRVLRRWWFRRPLSRRGKKGTQPHTIRSWVWGGTERREGREKLWSGCKKKK